MKRLIFHFLGVSLFFIGFATLPVYGQSTQIDSMLARASVLTRNYPDQAYDMAFQALSLANTGQSQTKLAQAHLTIGKIQWYQGDYRPAQEHFRQSLQIGQELADSLLIAQSRLALGTVAWRVGNFYGASSYYLTAQRMFESQLDSANMAEVHYWEGIVKADLENYQDALVDYRVALGLAQALEDTLLQANTLNFIGRAYRKQKMYDSALVAHQASFELYQAINDEIGISDYYNNMGSIYRRTGKLDSASLFFRNALAIQQQLQDKEGLADGYIDLGRTLGQMHRYNEAISYVVRGLDVAKDAGLKDDVRYGYQVLAGLYDSLDNYQEAFAYIRKYEAVKDSLYAAQMRYQLNQMRFDYENEKLVIDQAQERARIRQNILMVFVIGLSIILVLGVAGVFWFRRTQQEKRLNKRLESQNLLLQHERERSDNLLLNILPESIAKELKNSATGYVVPRLHPEVSVMFVDFKGFTGLAETMTPRQLVEELHQCFKTFDHIVEKHGLEKIKTIGDAYMCAGGLPNPLANHAQHTIRAGLEIQGFMQQLAKERAEKGHDYFEARIGIHSGSVISGVVGKHKFAYDIWGDTVNTAARMESSGAVGKVNISQSTYALIHQMAICTHRGKVQAKNKGEIDMYFVDWIA